MEGKGHPRKSTKSMACTEGQMSKRDHVKKYSGLENALISDVPGSPKYILDDVLNNKELMRSRNIWDKLNDDKSHCRAII